MATTPAKATFPLILEDTYVRQDEQGRFSLNDLHQAAGGEQRHRPNYWLETKQTQDLIAELGNSWNSMSSGTSIAGIPAIEAKTKVGTFVARELVYAYAMWISPAFHLQVIRTFDALATGRMGAAGSNAMIGQATGLPTAQLVALQVQGWKIVDRLKAEKVPELRQGVERTAQRAARVWA